MGRSFAAKLHRHLSFRFRSGRLEGESTYWAIPGKMQLLGKSKQGTSFPTGSGSSSRNILLSRPKSWDWRCRLCKYIPPLHSILVLCVVGFHCSIMPPDMLCHIVKRIQIPLLRPTTPGQTLDLHLPQRFSPAKLKKTGWEGPQTTGGLYVIHALYNMEVR